MPLFEENCYDRKPHQFIFITTIVSKEAPQFTDLFYCQKCLVQGKIDRAKPEGEDVVKEESSSSSSAASQK